MSIDAEGSAINAVVLYHKGCVDGLVAGWVANRNLGEQALYIPHQYGDPLPEVIQGKHLILVDLSLPAEEILALQRNKTVTSVLIIDHHKTAQPLLEFMTQVSTNSEYMEAVFNQDPEGESPLFICFDLERSGAVLTWMFFNEMPVFVRGEVPYVIRLVEDYDLWRFQYPDTLAINAWLRNLKAGFEEVDVLYQAEEHTYEKLVEIGNALLTYDKHLVHGITKGYVESGWFNGFRFALVNGPHHLRNEISDALLKDNAFDVVVVYNRRRDLTVYSLRSIKGGADVAAMAERFGGGGHVSASSYVVPHADPEGINKHWLKHLDPR